MKGKMVYLPCGRFSLRLFSSRVILTLSYMDVFLEGENAC